MQQNASECKFGDSNSWVILTSIEQRIKQKIEAVGVPLKDWDISIYRGVLTGCNEAFIISGSKRQEILDNCLDENEHQRTDALIRPILRGRDIKRYSYDWADLWLLYIPWHFPLQFDSTIVGASEKAERIFQEQYPTVYNHLLQYKPELSARNKAETGIRYEWYAMQRWGANYWEDFLKPKIVWKRVGSILRFSYDEDGTMALDSTCFATGSCIKYLVAILNSNMGHYLLKDAPKTGTGDLLISVQAVEPVRIPIPFEKTNNEFEALFNRQLYHFSQSTEDQINHKVYNLYNLSIEEIELIENKMDKL
ncbi:TaqI-like C-terminal specificity domain-containing protein [Dysgonomonas sp.]